MNMKCLFQAVSFLIVNGSIIYGCAQLSPRLAGTDTISVESSSPIYVQIIPTSVIQEGDELVIEGWVNRRSSSRSKYIPLGHIDITLYGPDGVIIREAFVGYTPRRIPRKYMLRSHFAVRLSVKPPPGSLVRLTFHPDLY